jgi:hypothetical protein
MDAGSCPLCLVNENVRHVLLNNIYWIDQQQHVDFMNVIFLYSDV